MNVGLSISSGMSSPPPEALGQRRFARPQITRQQQHGSCYQTIPQPLAQGEGGAIVGEQEGFGHEAGGEGGWV